MEPNTLEFVQRNVQFTWPEQNGDHLKYTLAESSVPFKPPKEHLGFANCACDQRISNGLFFTLASEEETDAVVLSLVTGVRY